MNTDITKPLSCPFCGCPSKDLETAEWYLEGGEAEAYECPVCLAGAPVDAWNKRVWHAPLPGEVLVDRSCVTDVLLGLKRIKRKLHDK